MSKLFVDNSHLCFPMITEDIKAMCRHVAPRNAILTGLLGAHFVSPWLTQSDSDWVSSVKYWWGINEGLERFCHVLSPIVLKEIIRHKNINEIIPFIGDESLERFCQSEGLRYRGVPSSLVKLNSKSNFFDLCSSLGIPIPDTKLLKKNTHYTADQEVYIKPDQSAGGWGARKLLTGETTFVLHEAIVQPNLDIMSSPSIQMAWENGDLVYYAITDQLISQGSYSGLVWPANSLNNRQGSLLIKWAVVLSEHLRERGLVDGYASIDFYVLADGTILVGDCNFRYGGASPIQSFVKNEQDVVVEQEFPWPFDWTPEWEEGKMIPLLPLRYGKMGVVYLGEDCKFLHSQLSKFIA